MSDKVRHYADEEIDITYDSRRCIHVAWDEILQAFATAAIGPSVRPVYQGERTSVPLLRRSVAAGLSCSADVHPARRGWARVARGSVSPACLLVTSRP
jgi:hypothetical protein